MDHGDRATPEPLPAHAPVPQPPVHHAGADAHPLVGHWVPDFGVANGGGTQRVAELARDGRPLLVDFTDGSVVAAGVADVADQITVAAGCPVGDVPATAVLVRPDGYVAWASSAVQPDLDELGRVLTHWFGITPGAISN